VRHCAALCGIVRVVRLCDSASGSVWQCERQQCAAMRAAVCGSARAEQCAAVQRCGSVREFATVRRCVVVRVAVCGSMRTSVWQCVRQCMCDCLATQPCVEVRQCAAARTAVCSSATVCGRVRQQGAAGCSGVRQGQCAAMRQCAVARAAVCGSARDYGVCLFLFNNHIICV
jgi:hypothetical protein